MIRLRNYQKPACKHCISRLNTYYNSLLIAPTGAGKTIMLSKICGDLIKQNKLRCLFLVHRDEINEQNREAFRFVNPTIQTSFFKGQLKACTTATFGMVQTVSKVFDKLPPFDMICIDECHRGLAESYIKIIIHQSNMAKESCRKFYLFGATATPNRGDKQSLFKLFDNFYQIPIKELFQTKALVYPKFVDITPKTNTENGITGLSDDEYSKLVMDGITLAKSMGKKKIIVFFPNHSRMNYVVAKNYIENLSILSDSLNATCRKEEIERFTKDENESCILFNIDICTEGFDYQPTDCVIFARRIGKDTKGLYIQIAGRCLRGIDPTKFNTIKKEGLVLDLGGNILLHGDLSQEFNSEVKKTGENKDGLTLKDILGEDYEEIVGSIKKEEKENTGKILINKEVEMLLYDVDNPFIEVIETPNNGIARVAFNNKRGIICIEENIYVTSNSKDWSIIGKAEEKNIMQAWDTIKPCFPTERDTRPPANIMYTLIGTEYSLVSLDWYRGECIIALKQFLKQGIKTNDI